MHATVNQLKRRVWGYGRGTNAHNCQLAEKKGVGIWKRNKCTQLSTS